MKKLKTLMLMFFFLLSACSLIPKTPVYMLCTADKNLNPSTASMALPVRLKIYQLSDSIPFKQATFRELWKSDVTTLGPSLLDKRELILNPGDKQQIKIPRHPQAEFIAVVGIFRKHSVRDWKMIKPLPGQLNTLIKPLQIYVENYHVEIH